MFLELKEHLESFRIAEETGKMQRRISLKIFGVYFIFKYSGTIPDKVSFCRQNCIVNYSVTQFFVFVVALCHREQIALVDHAKQVVSILFYQLGKY